MSNGSEHVPESSTLDGATTEPEPGVESNPGEFAVVWNRHTEEERAEMLRTIRERQRQAERCFMSDHERHIAALVAQRDALQGRIDAALFQVTGMEELYPREMIADTLRGKTR